MVLRLTITLAVMTLGACGTCFAQERPEFYLGAGGGRSTLREDQAFLPGPLAPPLAAEQHDTGWKVFAGWRPVSFVGAELEYTSFGHADADMMRVITLPTFVDNEDVTIQGRARALSAFVVGFVPLPVPWLDPYVKAGLANLQTHYRYDIVENYICPPGVFCLAPRSTTLDSRIWWDLIYGAGVRVRFGAVSLSAEYERVRDNGPHHVQSARPGDPDLLSLAISWGWR